RLELVDVDANRQQRVALALIAAERLEVVGGRKAVGENPHAHAARDGLAEQTLAQWSRHEVRRLDRHRLLRALDEPDQLVGTRAAATDPAPSSVLARDVADEGDAVRPHQRS